MTFQIYALYSILKFFNHGDVVRSDPDAVRRNGPITERLIERTHFGPGPF